MRMTDYLAGQEQYYKQGYEAENVESWVFRTYGRVFKSQFGMDGSHGERMLDFGCGQGAAVRFFASKGFDAYGVDISQPDIARAIEIAPRLKDHFAVIPPKPSPDDRFFGGHFDLVISIQTLYLLNDVDLPVRIRSLYEMLKPGGLIFVSMMGTGHHYYGRSTPAASGMRRVSFKTERITVDDLYVNFTHSEEELLSRFAMFQRVHLGYYDLKYREDEGGSFHYTFVGRKSRETT
jgi:SAM-dependent methyltransferase